MLHGPALGNMLSGTFTQVLMLTDEVDASQASASTASWSKAISRENKGHAYILDKSVWLTRR